MVDINDLVFIWLPILMVSFSSFLYFISTKHLKRKYGKIRFDIFLKNSPSRINWKNSIILYFILNFILLSGPFTDGSFKWYFIFSPLSIITHLLVRVIFNYNPDAISKMNDEFDKISENEVSRIERENKINELL